MKSGLLPKFIALALAAGLGAAAANAQTTADTDTGTTPATAPATASTPTSRLAARFSDWAGSSENATSLVTGLRTGTPITLTSGGSADGTAGATTFTSPTKPMGYGNIRIAIALAQQQLASQGITQPTAQQMQTSLMGGTFTNADGTQTTTQGILQMRASGMGWGKIANSMGFKLGSVMSGKAAATPAAKAGAGITTAAGGSTGAAARTQHAKADSGIVTAAGGAGGGITTGMGNAYGHAGAGSGIVTAHGNSGAGGNAGGHGKSGK